MSPENLIPLVNLALTVAGGLYAYLRHMKAQAERWARLELTLAHIGERMTRVEGALGIAASAAQPPAPPAAGRRLNGSRG